MAGPPFRTDDPEPVELTHWEFYVASMQQFQNQETAATCPHFEVNYGALPNLQVHLVVPFAYAHSIEGTHYGYSDTEIGVKFRFVDETVSTPQIGVFPLVELPTGNQNNQLGSGKVQAFLPAWVQKSWGKFTTYAGGGFWYNPGVGQENWGFSGWEGQYDVSEILTLGGELFFQSADSQDSQSGSSFNAGGFVNLSEHHHILFSLGHSISGDPSVTGYIGFQLTL